MKIYLLDDNRSNEIPDKLLSVIAHYQEQGIVVHLPHLCKRRVEDRKRITDINPETDIVFYHQSYSDSNLENKFLNSGDMIEAIKKRLHSTKTPHIGFSGSVWENRYFPATSDAPEWGEMTKKDFYDRLEKLLEMVSENKTDFLRSFVENTMESAVAKAEEVNISAEEDSAPMPLNDLPKIEINYIGNGNFTVGSDPEAVVNYDSVAGCGKLIEILKKYNVEEVHQIVMPPLKGNAGPSAGAIRRMVLALRLSVHDLKKRSLWPILFRSGKDAMAFISEFAKSANSDVLWFKGSYIQGVNDANILTLTPEDYLYNFLKEVKVNPISDVGNHTIANDWGAYVVARNIPNFDWKPLYKAALNKDPLYLTYLMCNRIKTVEELNGILGKGGKVKQSTVKVFKSNPTVKILLIDDQDDAWAGVIKGLFKGVTVDVLGKSNGMLNSDPSTNFLTEEAENIIDHSEAYDTILLDLRLGGTAEEHIVNGDECSGMKILKRITEKNPAVQVIMFTSSNKAWNLKKALSMAAGYYIKESPLQVFSEEETKKNISDLISTVERAISYDGLVDCIETLQKIINDDSGDYSHLYIVEDEYKAAIIQQLQIVSTMAVNKSHTENKDWSYEFIALFQVLEMLKTLSNNCGKEDRSQCLSDLLFDIWAASPEMENLTDKVRKLRNKIIHKNEEYITATFEDFLNLWNVTSTLLKEME